jgi:hypothetical protein
MSNDKDVEIDPRFDPAFQRGFDTSIPIEEYLPDPLPRTTAVQPVASEPVIATSTVVPAKPVALPDPVSDSSEAKSAVVASDPDAPVDEATDTDPASDAALESSPSRNPFLLFLGIISIALVAAGIWLFVRSGDAFNSKEVRSQGDYMSLTATIQMAPFIALLGGATAIGVLFVFAAKWRRRR